MVFDKMVQDWTMWNYALTLIVCMYGALLFAWWAKKAGRPSAVFLYVMCIFIAEGWAMSIATYARLEHLYVSMDRYNDFITNSWFWFLRQLPTTIVLATLATHMSIRAFCKRKHRMSNGISREELAKNLVTSEAARLVSEAAIVAAEVVATASKIAAEKVAKEATDAAKLARASSDHIISAIRNIHKVRSDDHV